VVNFILEKQEGQTLLEIILAFGVSLLMLSAIVFVIITSLSNAQYTKNQNLAASYAQEGMTVVRQIRDSGWTTFCSTYVDSNYCLPQNNVLASYDNDAKKCSQNGIVGIFARKVELIHDSSACCPDNTTTCPSGNCSSVTRGSKATVTVSWTDNKCPSGTPLCHNVQLISCFSNINSVQ